MSSRAPLIQRNFGIRQVSSFDEARAATGMRVLRLSHAGAGGPTIYVASFESDLGTLCVYPFGPRRTVWLSQARNPFGAPTAPQDVARGASEVNGRTVEWIGAVRMRGSSAWSDRGSAAWGVIDASHYRLQSGSLDAAEIVELAAGLI